MANFSMGFIVFLLLSLASQSQAVESSSVVKNESQDDLRGLEQTSSPAPSSSPSPSSYVSTSSPGPYQPRVLPVELKPRRAFGTIVAQSSIWCDGAQMVWPIGHQADDERPYCRNGDSFSPSPKVITDKNDRLNARDTNRIDRHQCETMDVNRDGRNDLICVVG